jgi:hypothetical protein
LIAILASKIPVTFWFARISSIQKYPFASVALVLDCPYFRGFGDVSQCYPFKSAVTLPQVCPGGIHDRSGLAHSLYRYRMV